MIFKYLSQEFDCKVLHLVKQKWFYPYKYISGFEKFKEESVSKRKRFIVLSQVKKREGLG